MNPFDLPGPQFLGFYVVFAAAILTFVWSRTRGPADSPATLSFMTSDPYRIACLREGEAETVRLAIFNLVDRGLLEFDGTRLRTAHADSAELVRRPLDRAVLSACRAYATVKELEANPALRTLAGEYRRELAGQKLMLADSDRAGRLRLFMATAGLLAGVSVVKIVVAIARGRHNIAFLVILTFIACIAALVVCTREKSIAGREMLSNLKGLTKRLMLRADTIKPGGATNEALLLASVYGLWALPSTAFAVVHTLFPRPGGDGGGDGGSSDSDGGGGCGGGCGGCGGE